MFNFRSAKHGGIWFLSFGRLNISFSVTSRATYERRQAEQLEARIAAIMAADLAEARRVDLFAAELLKACR
jgi:hypothetical protein